MEGRRPVAATQHPVAKTFAHLWQGPPHKVEGVLHEGDLRSRLDEPPRDLTPDPAENRRSIRKLAELNPALILPGHGPAVTDMSAFERFVTALPG